MPLRNIAVVPPGGWIFDQVDTNGNPIKKFKSMGLAWELASQIADFRKGNSLPRATPREALHDIEESTCARLHNDPNHCVQKKTSGIRAAIDHQLKNAKHAADGGRILVDWLGDGAVPVPIEMAQRRANVCLHGGPDDKPCPENRDGHSLLNLTANTIRAIAEQMNAREHLRLRVEGEENIHSCAICRCPLKLKIHVPIETILSHTDDETLMAMPQYCWMKTEQQTQTT